jgi:hypothetical protein
VSRRDSLLSSTFTEGLHTERTDASPGVGWVKSRFKRELISSSSCQGERKGERRV